MIPIPITWYVIAGMAVALGGVSYLAYDAIEDKGRLVIERDEARRVAQSNADALVQFKAQTAADMRILTEDAERARKAARGVVVIRQEIARDPEANDRVCSPVDRFLDRLRQSGAPDGAQGRAGRDTGTAAPVR